MRCLSCKYDLSKLTEPRCPECGRAFDPNDPATFSRNRFGFGPTALIIHHAGLLILITLAFLLVFVEIHKPWIVFGALAMCLLLVFNFVTALVLAFRARLYKD